MSESEVLFTTIESYLRDQRSISRQNLSGLADWELMLPDLFDELSVENFKLCDLSKASQDIRLDRSVDYALQASLGESGEIPYRQALLSYFQVKRAAATYDEVKVFFQHYPDKKGSETRSFIGLRTLVFSWSGLSGGPLDDFSLNLRPSLAGLKVNPAGVLTSSPRPYPLSPLGEAQIYAVGLEPNHRILRAQYSNFPETGHTGTIVVPTLLRSPHLGL